MGGENKDTSSSIDTLYESTRYSLDTEWDLFKSYDRKASTLLAATTAILSIYIGINIFISDLFVRPSSIFSPMGYSYILVIIIVIFFVCITARHLIGAILAALNCLRRVEFIRSPNPIRLNEVSIKRPDLQTKIAIIKGTMEAWAKNHDFFNVDKAGCIISSLDHLKTAIIFLILSLAIDWSLLILYNLYFIGV